MSGGFHIELPPEALDAIAERVARILAERGDPADPDPKNPADPDPNNGFLDVAGAAAYLSCPTSRIYALVRAKRLPHYKDGSRLLFDRQELRNYVRGGGARRP